MNILAGGSRAEDFNLAELQFLFSLKFGNVLNKLQEMFAQEKNNLYLLVD